jgi:aminoglycoside 6'-N-acetyltransferase I
MKIMDLRPGDERLVEQAAGLLVDGFKDNAPAAWPDRDAVLREVKESLAEGRISRVAVDEAGNILGWIGGVAEYDGHVWELHPLVVRRDCRRQGIGRALVADFEAQVRMRGGYTIRVGADDENNQTSLGGVDLYPNVLEHLARIKNLRGHPYEFYQKLGFVIVGVMPDANGFGKPDVYLAKRVGKS